MTPHDAKTDAPDAGKRDGHDYVLSITQQCTKVRI
jgi:hypothetical protein